MKLEELKKLCDEATPGPWYATWDIREDDPDRDDEDVWTVGPKSDEQNWKTDSAYPGYGVYKRDALLMAAARTMLPKLVAVAEAALRFTDVDYEDALGSRSQGEVERLRTVFAALEAE